MVFGPKEKKSFSRWGSLERRCSYMLLTMKLSVRRRLFFVTTVVLMCIFSFVILVNQKNLINYDLQLVSTSWNLNLNKNLQNSQNISIRQTIDSLNDEQTIFNEEMYGAIANDSIVLVVQVHKRTTYLRHLISSLSKARDISKTLLIFSHDVYDDEINELIHSINFCKVMQIFYPHSIQIHPNEFPGTDPKDCRRDVGKERALESKCNNAYYPDLYGHYREAVFTQMKHHWWWKLNRIFDQLRVTSHHTGLLVLLEEDYFVAPDFLYVLGEQKAMSEKFCPYCNILSLGTYEKIIDKENYNQLEISPWITSKHNMGMAFNRETWHEIKSCAKYFCDYDDYNYDWSLQNINYSCLKEKLFALIIRGPRVFHIGQCGMHHNGDCDSSHMITKVQGMIQNVGKSGLLFPKNLRLARSYDEVDVFDTLKANGGWSDLRDILLCLNMTLAT